MKLGKIRVACLQYRSRKSYAEPCRVTLKRNGSDQDAPQPEKTGIGYRLHHGANLGRWGGQIGFPDEGGNQFTPGAVVCLDILEILDAAVDVLVVRRPHVTAYLLPVTG